MVFGRTLEKVEKVAAAIRRGGGRATAYAVDTTQEAAVTERAMKIDAIASTVPHL
jgi:hypothetical protein